eukprot:scaffold149409_cov27-Tisochrysis_lutea.AAC.1
MTCLSGHPHNMASDMLAIHTHTYTHRLCASSSSRQQPGQPASRGPLVTNSSRAEAAPDR